MISYRFKVFAKPIVVVLAFIIVIGVIDTRNRYNNAIANIKSSEPIPIVCDTNLTHERNSLTLRYWDFVNNFSIGASAKALLKNESQLPNLWRPEKECLSQDDDRILSQLIWTMETANASNVSSEAESKMKTIYVADSFRWWDKTNWASPHILNEDDCPGTSGVFHKCTFTEKEDSMDAIITVRDGAHGKHFDVPSHVLRFYFILESPIHSSAILSKTNDLSATFYRGSDINTPYEKWVYTDPDVKFKDQEKDYSQGKSKMAAIFTSNCNAWNGRMKYVKELQKHVEVDVYGNCGPKKCKKTNQGECYEMLKRDYYFYLSFENSNCRDYVTEKLFTNAFKNDVVPIVLGAHSEDYQAMCPEKSYIHVEDFSGPEQLANYMKWLAGNKNEYNAYFRWKGTGKFIDTSFFCRVCSMVHYADVMPPPERKQEYVWKKQDAINNKMCLPAGQWYWNSRSS